MSRFENKLCPVCRKPLTDKDDIVVCPVCGTPHHRECYMKNNRCGVEEWHASGFVWEGHLPGEEPQEPEQPQQPQEAEQNIPSGSGDPHYAEYPGGVPQGQPMDLEEFLDQLKNQTMDDTRGADGVSPKELSCYVGKSVMHYSQAFSVFRSPVMPGQKPRRAFFNICAGLFSPVHQFYRKLDGVGLILVLLELAYYVPALFTLSAGGAASSPVLGTIQMIASLLNFVAMVFMCMFGDYIYYRHCVKRIKQIRMNFDDGRAEGYYEALNEKGSPSWLRAIISILVVYLLEAVVMLYFMHPGQSTLL